MNKLTSAKLEKEEQAYKFTLFSNKLNRNGWLVEPEGMHTENYLANPVVLHQHKSQDFPIGKSINLKATKTKMESGEFDEEDDLAMEVKGKYDRGYMNAVSIGYLPIEQELLNPDEVDQDDWWAMLFADYRITESELLEFSTVTVPADPTAIRRQSYEKRRQDFMDRVELALKQGVSPYTSSKSNHLSDTQVEQILARPYTKEQINQLLEKK